MVNLQFPLVETLWKSFWRFSEGQTSDTNTLDLWELLTHTCIDFSYNHRHCDVCLTDVSLCLYSHDESEKRLPKSVLVLLCKYEPVLHWTRECDNLLYQSLVEILIPDVLRPIPSELHNSTQTLYKLHPLPWAVRYTTLRTPSQSLSTLVPISYTVLHKTNIHSKSHNSIRHKSTWLHSDFI